MNLFGLLGHIITHVNAYTSNSGQGLNRTEHQSGYRQYCNAIPEIEFATTSTAASSNHCFCCRVLGLFCKRVIGHGTRKHPNRVVLRSNRHLLDLYLARRDLVMAPYHHCKCLRLKVGRTVHAGRSVLKVI